MSQRRPNIERVQVAATLRRMREQAGVTREQAGEVLGCTHSKIGDLETGRSAPKPIELERLLDHYGVASEDRADLMEFAQASRRRRPRSPYAAAAIPGTHRRAVDLEAQAVSSTYYSGEAIPGILQVRPYAEAMLRWGNTHPPEDVQRLLALRLSRSGELTRTGRPPLRCWCILGEAAGVRRRAAGDARAAGASGGRQSHVRERGGAGAPARCWRAQLPRHDGDALPLPAAGTRPAVDGQLRAQYDLRP
jgi:transcriptional regulator with XRE-family HTH domain